jgi:hypothetical protein
MLSVIMSASVPAWIAALVSGIATGEALCADKLAGLTDAQVELLIWHRVEVFVDAPTPTQGRGCGVTM